MFLCRFYFLRLSFFTLSSQVSPLASQISGLLWNHSCFSSLFICWPFLSPRSSTNGTAPLFHPRCFDPWRWFFLSTKLQLVSLTKFSHVPVSYRPGVAFMPVRAARGCKRWEDQKFILILGYIASFRPALTTWDSVSKQTNKSTTLPKTWQNL